LSTYWITGARGFIGRHLARTLADGGHQVAGVGHGAWPAGDAAAWGVSYWLNGDVSVTNLGQMRSALGSPAAVFHLAGGSSVGAAIASPHEDFERTVVTTARLLEWLRQHSPDTGLMAVSSAAVYGAGHEAPIPEDGVLNPFSPYGTHKLVMEELCRSYAVNYGLSVVLPRLFSVYGPELKKQLLWDLCHKLQAGGAVQLGGSGEEQRDWTHVGDVVTALAQLMGEASSAAQIINVAGGVSVSVREVAALVAEAWDAGQESSSVSFSGNSRSGDPEFLVADVARMGSLGLSCRLPLAGGIAEYVSWFRSYKVSA
jgi:UDP-glucose 4-epimerase